MLRISTLKTSLSLSESETLIFVFGSNLAGRHGKGAALTARKYHGAIYGQGKGLQGNSYAIPTKNERIRTLPLAEIKGYVDQFITFAKGCPDLIFYVSPIGCGLAGYKPHEIAPLFSEAVNMSNIKLCDAFNDVLNPPAGGLW